MMSIRILPLFLFLPWAVHCQLPVSGIVKDSLNQKPISFAHVVVPGTFAGTYTDGEGRFLLRGLRGDRVALRISCIGYLTVERMVQPGERALEIVLARAMILTDEVVVSATRAGEKNAMAYSEVDRETIDRNNFGRDMPYLLASTLSAVVTSDAGTGIGYTGLRIRGTDASRINVTINGVPVNDAESQLVYWVDLPDLASSADNVQVQRGVGTSTHGAGAFGGSVNVQTNKLIQDPYVRSDHAFGSFGTVKNSLSAGTGLLHDHWTFDIRLSKINSDGYVDRASADLKSIFISQGYYSSKAMVRLHIFSGKEITYQSWYGTPQSAIEGDVQGMIDFTVRNFLDSQDSLNLLTAGRTYNYYLYHNQVDDYQQDNYQLHLAYEPMPKVTLSTALHYTRGRGFYEEFKKDQLLSDYGLPDSVPGFVLSPVSLVRRKWLDNDFYGAVWSLRYDPGQSVSLILGGGWNRYLGDHLDEVIWAEFLPVETIPFGYSFDSGDKTDFNSYIRAVYDVGKKISLYGDLQFRRVKYAFTGPVGDGGLAAQADVLSFFNPKAGITVKPDEKQTWYASVAVGNKEPSRNDYVDNLFGQRPVAERLYDIEAGFRYKLPKVFGAVNFYHMQYDNQLALNGSLNDVGEPVRVNIAESYRQGAEVEAGWKVTRRISLKAQATAGRSRIREYKEILADYDVFVNDTVVYRNTSLAYSPELIVRGEMLWEPVDNLSLSISGKYISRQYLDNTSSGDRFINAYWYSDFQAGYAFHTRLIHRIRLGLLVSNIFDRLYESNGYTYSYRYGGEIITENFYYPQAGTSVVGRVTLEF